MGFRSKVEHVIQYRNSYALSFSAAMGSIFYGWDVGLIGGILSLPSFKHYFGINKLSATAVANLNGNIVSILQAGCFFGALSTGYISGRFGRKYPLLIAGLIYIIGSVIQTVSGLGSSQTVALRVLYFSRFLGGFGLGMTTALIPSYISECTPKIIRGRCTGLIQVCNNLGIMLSFWVNYGSVLHVPYGDMQWRMPFAIQVIPGVFFFLLMLFQPESPRWLVEQQRYDEAARSLAYASRVAVDDKSVLETIEEIKADLAGNQRTSLWRQFRMMGESRVTAIRSFYPSLIMLCQQWTGTNAINYFSPQIFAGLGITGTESGLFATGIYGIVKFVSVAASVILAVEGVGRKMCLLVGGLGQGLMMFWIGGYSALHPQSTVVPSSYVSLVAVYLYAAFYGVGYGPVPWIVAGEVSPNHVRTASMCLAVGVNWAFSFMISRITPNMLQGITYGTFLLFGCCCMLMTVWVYFFVPETRGYALEDVRFLYENDLIVRSIQDAPGGRFFLGGRRAAPLAELKNAAGLDTGSPDSVSVEKADGEMIEHV